jgi:hypothetical protein
MDAQRSQIPTIGFYSWFTEVAEEIIMDDIPEESTKSQRPGPSIKLQNPDAGHNDTNSITPQFPNNPNLGMLEASRMKNIQNSIGALAGIGSAALGVGLANSLRDSMGAITGMGFYDGIPSWQKSMQESVSAILRVSSLDGIPHWQKSMQESVSAILRVSSLGGIPHWQKSMQESVSAILRVSSFGRISELQKLMDSLPYHGILDLKAKTWLEYARSMPDCSALRPPRLDAFTAILEKYDSKIAVQVEAFTHVPYLKAYQKHALIAHESRQRSFRLGPADIEYADSFAKGISATQALVDQIAEVAGDRENLDISSIEAEVFDILAKEGKGYPVPLSGAIQAVNSNNPDKARQTMASLRELTTHLLHKLSPDSEVKKWSNRSEHYVSGRPTRACRIEYIFKDCAGSSIKPFIENEIKFIKDFFDFLNGGTHSLDTRLDGDDLQYAIYKTESLVLLLLKYARR